MNVGANLLTSLGRSKDSDNRYLEMFLLCRHCIEPWQLGIKFCWCSLIMVDTIKPDTKEIHWTSSCAELAEQNNFESMAEWRASRLGAIAK